MNLFFLIWLKYTILRINYQIKTHISYIFEPIGDIIFNPPALYSVHAIGNTKTKNNMLTNKTIFINHIFRIFSIIIIIHFNQNNSIHTKLKTVTRCRG